MEDGLGESLGDDYLRDSLDGELWNGWVSRFEIDFWMIRVRIRIRVRFRVG